MNPEPCIEKGHAWLRNCNVHEFVDKMKGCFFSVIPAPPCHPRRLSSPPVPDLIGDPVK